MTIINLTEKIKIILRSLGELICHRGHLITTYMDNILLFYNDLPTSTWHMEIVSYLFQQKVKSKLNCNYIVHHSNCGLNICLLFGTVQLEQQQRWTNLILHYLEDMLTLFQHVVKVPVKFSETVYFLQPCTLSYFSAAYFSHLMH